VAQFKRFDFFTCDEPRPGRPKRVITPELFDQILELIFEDGRISSKTIAEQQRFGSIIHEDMNMRKLSAQWVLKCLIADEKHEQCQSSDQLLEFFSAMRDPN
jgi:hypothetical protein